MVGAAGFSGPRGEKVSTLIAWRAYGDRGDGVTSEERYLKRRPIWK